VKFRTKNITTAAVKFDPNSYLNLLLV